MRRTLVAVAVMLFAGTLFADEITKRTAITLNERVMVVGNPTVTLEPGKYVIRLMRHDHNPNIVQIMNDREDRLFTTVLAIANYRLEPTNKTVFRFWETPVGNPIALREWFGPGDRWGQEFVLPKGLTPKYAAVTVEPTPEPPAEVAKVEAPPIEVTREPEFVAEPEPEPAPVEAAAEPAPPVAIAETPAEPETLPATASPFFAIGLFGALTAGAGLLLRKTS